MPAGCVGAALSKFCPELPLQLPPALSKPRKEGRCCPGTGAPGWGSGALWVPSVQAWFALCSAGAGAAFAPLCWGWSWHSPSWPGQGSGAAGEQSLSICSSSKLVQKKGNTAQPLVQNTQPQVPLMHRVREYLKQMFNVAQRQSSREQGLPSTLSNTGSRAEPLQAELPVPRAKA